MRGHSTFFFRIFISGVTIWHTSTAIISARIGRLPKIVIDCNPTYSLFLLALRSLDKYRTPSCNGANTVKIATNEFSRQTAQLNVKLAANAATRGI